MRELRVFPRIPVHLKVNFDDGATAFADSLSLGGVFIRTSRPLPIGTETVLELEDAGGPPIMIRGRVVWARLLGEIREDGMGVQFLEAPPARLRNLLTSKVA